MKPDTGPQTVLVIDDMSVILKMLKKQLEHWGYRALTASSGEEGLKLAEAEQPDLVILDVIMPKMKGWEVCARLKQSERTRHAPIMFLTSLGLADHVRSGLDVGADDYIIKPFKPEDLRERIMICLLRHPRSQPTAHTSP